MTKLDYRRKGQCNPTRARWYSTWATIIVMVFALVLLATAALAAILIIATRLLFGHWHGVFGIPL